MSFTLFYCSLSLDFFYRKCVFPLNISCYLKRACGNESFKKCLCFLICFIFVAIVSFAYSDIIATFPSAFITVACGQPGVTQNIPLRIEVDLNEQFAIQLGWNVDYNFRYKTYTRNIHCSSLAYEPHDGTGNGVNRAGFKVNIIREGNHKDGYTYREDILMNINNTPCNGHDFE